MKTVVIFGGSGFIGQNIIRRLSIRGYQIIIPYQKSIDEAKIRLYGKLGQVVPVRFQGLTDKIITNIINNSDFVLNLKTIWEEKKNQSYEKNILRFNIDLANLLKKADKNKGYIFFSGIGVNNNSFSKRVRFINKTENYISKNLMKFAIIRPSIVIGYGDKFITRLEMIFKLFFLIPLFGKGNAKIQPVFVDDVAFAIEKILDKKIEKDIYEFGGPEIYTYRSIYKLIAQTLNIKRIFVPIPFFVAKFVVSLIEKTPINLITKDQLYLFIENNTVSNKYRNFASIGVKAQDVSIILKKIISY